MTQSVAKPQFNIGSVLSRSFSTLLKNPGVFCGLTLAATLPPYLIQLLLPATTGAGALPVAAIVGSILSSILTLVAQGAIAYGVYQELRGKKAAFGASLAHGMSRMGALILAAILVGLGVGLGMLLLVVPGIILLCLWSVTIQVCVVEKRGATESMSRSAALTKGYRLPIFGLLLIVGVASIIFTAVATFIGINVLGSPLVFALIAGIIAVVPSAFSNVMAAIIYSDLRAMKEGVTLDSLTSVFD